MVHMHHQTRHHIPTDRNHVTESNLMCGESHDRTGGSCKKKQLTGRYVVIEGHLIYCKPGAQETGSGEGLGIDRICLYKE